jgi:hypothetical protein
MEVHEVLCLYSWFMVIGKKVPAFFSMILVVYIFLCSEKLGRLFASINRKDDYRRFL